MINDMLNQLADLLWYLSIAIGLAVLVWGTEREGIDSREAFIAGMFGMVGGFLGGSLTVSGGLPPGISANPATWLQVVYAEKAVFGVLVGGALCSAIWLIIRRQSAMRFADAAAPAVALAYVIARLDCFAHGHCFGIPTDVPWSVTFVPGTQAFVAQVAAGLIAPDALHTLPVHPTQLYHALLGVAAFVVLLRMKAGAPGRRFAAALILYGAGRFVIEFFRGDAILIFGPLDANHIAALVMFVMGVALWRFRAALVTASAPVLSTRHCT